MNYPNKAAEVPTGNDTSFQTVETTVTTVKTVPVTSQPEILNELTGNIVHDNRVVLQKKKERHEQDVEALKNTEEQLA